MIIIGTANNKLVGKASHGESWSMAKIGLVDRNTMNVGGVKTKGRGLLFASAARFLAEDAHEFALG